MKCRYAVEPAKKHLSARALEACGVTGQIGAGKTVNNTIVLKCFSLRIEFRYPFVRAHPQIAPLILQKAVHYVAGKTISLVISSKLACPGVEFIQTILGGNPDPAGPVGVRGIHSRVTQ